MSKPTQTEPKKELPKTWFNFPAFEFSCQAVDVEEAQKLLQIFLNQSQTK